MYWLASALFGRDPLQSDTNRTGSKSLFFHYLRLLYCTHQMLTVMVLSQHRVSSSETIRPRAPCGGRCMAHITRMWSAVCLMAPTRNLVKERDPICAWRNKIVQHQFISQAIELDPSCLGQA